MSKIIRIDLGTTNSVVAVMEGGEPVVNYQSGAAADAIGCRVHENRRQLVARSRSARRSPTPKTPSSRSSGSGAEDDETSSKPCGALPR